jgi:DNA-binding response OmpR family regulator
MHGTGNIFVKESKVPNLTRNILVIEDNDAVRSVIQMMLEDAGYTVTGTGAADQALEIIHSKEFDLIICGASVLTEKTETDRERPPMLLISGAIDQISN